MPTRSALDRLETSITEASLQVRLSSTASVRFERGDDRRRVRLSFGRSGAGPDVSIQPSAVDRVVRDQARLAGVDPNRWCGEIVGLLLDWHPELDWLGRRPERLVAAVGAFTHPLLDPLYRDGRVAMGEVPRWASPILRAPDAGEAARRLAHGPATRRVVRALAGALVGRDEMIDVERLGLAVAAAGLVTGDELANLLEAPSSDGAVPAPLSVEEVRAIRTALGWYPADRRAPLLIDVARSGRAAELARLSGRLRWVIDSAPRPLPVRLAALAELCGRLVPVVAAPPPAAAAPPAVAADVRPVRRAPPRRPGQVARVAPAAPPTAPPSWPIHPDLLAVSERRVGELTLCVPTSVAELGSWSRRLHNCLDTFGPAVAHGRSWVIGIRRDDELLGAVEICPATRRLRQAQGPRNRALPAAVYDRVVETLGDLGLLRVHRRT